MGMARLKADSVPEKRCHTVIVSFPDATCIHNVMSATFECNAWLMEHIMRKERIAY